MTHVKFSHRPFEKSFNNLIDDLFTELPVLYKTGFNNGNGFAPANVKEKDKSYEIEIVAPGFEKADFKVNVNENVLTISAEKKEEAKEENVKQVRKEYSFRSFKRSFTIDEKVDTNSIEARYVNGVLTLNLPKKEQVKASAQEITIQ